MTNDRPRTTNQAVLAQYRNLFGDKTRYGTHLNDYFDRQGITAVRYEPDPYSNKTWWIHTTLPKSSSEIFEISREVLVVYADYQNLHPRILNQISDRFQSHESLDPDVVLIASPSSQVNRFANQPSQGVSIVPVSVNALESNDDIALKKLLQQWLPVFDRYNVTRPLQKTDELFGRSHELADIEHSLRNGQSVGLFGLRKAGKTSVLNALRFTRTRQRAYVIQIDISKLTNGLQFRRKILEEAHDSAIKLLRSKQRSTAFLTHSSTLRTLDSNGRATPDVDALTMNWIDDLSEIIGHVRLPLEIILDEIDTIFPGQSSQYEPAELKDFAIAMRQLRGLLQADRSDAAQAVLLCAGVNPAIFESSITPDGRNNQLYKLVRLLFLKPLTLDDSSRMVRRLGQKMGIKYGGEDTTSRLFSLFGGHPMLTRQACSNICQLRPDGVFPWTVALEEIDLVANMRGIDSVQAQSKEIAVQFSQWFSSEAEILAALWGSDTDLRNLAVEMVHQDEDVVKHALAYGLIDNVTGLSPRVQIVADAFSRLS